MDLNWDAVMANWTSRGMNCIAGRSSLAQDASLRVKLNCLEIIEEAEWEIDTGGEGEGECFSSDACMRGHVPYAQDTPFFRRSKVSELGLLVMTQCSICIQQICPFC